jgi:hypothetical protein
LSSIAAISLAIGLAKIMHGLHIRVYCQIPFLLKT